LARQSAVGNVGLFYFERSVSRGVIADTPRRTRAARPQVFVPVEQTELLSSGSRRADGAAAWHRAGDAAALR
jgi:hypothetical protein